MGTVIRLRAPENDATVHTPAAPTYGDKMALVAGMTRLGNATGRLQRLALAVAASCEPGDHTWLPSSVPDVEPGRAAEDMDAALAELRGVIAEFSTVAFTLAHAVDSKVRASS
jgi:hypothetical protein